ncbi:hypothetical protein PGT21_001540 [Puccinia graminis f. sp. tritici]|uniref:Uncharacterized protein n=1 Tax=Puccinia graminis f. sp. tritici TaxID=56615 RepID=A0A5B0P8C2_PUCGR|nr:hypothetical protein PGT21_001540 [Puccinia graminis f. sp. tritici]KAA1134373.1 hypothetical protein PGTUg99_035857 [Puccinia graminis f. sp. tritici]
MEKQTPESFVGSKSDWMFSYPESTSKHPTALANEDEDQSVYLRRQLAQRHTRRQNQASESSSLFKREFFGNEVGQGVVTLRPHYPPGVFDEATVPPLVILPAETLAPPFGSVINSQADNNLENSDANLSTEQQITGHPGVISEGIPSKISSPTTSVSPPLPPSTQDKSKSNPSRVTTSTSDSHRNFRPDLKEFDAQEFQTLPQGPGLKSNDQNDQTKNPPQLWMLVVSCIFLFLLIIVSVIVLKKKRYRVTFKPFKIAKAPKRVGSGESDKFGQTPAVSQLSRRSKIPQSSDDHTEERLISSQYQNRETFSSTMAMVGPHPNLGAKRNPQSFSTGGIFVRLQRFFKFKESEAKRPTSPSTQASILTSDSERLDFSKPPLPLPLPEIYLSQPDPTHQNAKAASNYQNLTADPNQKSHSLCVSAMSPLKNSPMIQFNEIHPETVELHSIRTDQIEIVY